MSTPAQKPKRRTLSIILRTVGVIAFTPLLSMYFASAMVIPREWVRLGFPLPERHPLQWQQGTDLFEDSEVGLSLLKMGITPDNAPQLAVAALLLLGLSLMVLLTPRIRRRAIFLQWGPLALWGTCLFFAAFWEHRFGSGSIVDFLVAGAICSTFWMAIMLLAGWSHRTGSAALAHWGSATLLFGSAVMMAGVFALLGLLVGWGVYLQGLGLLLYSIAGFLRPERPPKVSDTPDPSAACGYCGTLNPPSAASCASCGAPLKSAGPAGPTTTVPTTALEGPPNPGVVLGVTRDPVTRSGCGSQRRNEPKTAFVIPLLIGVIGGVVGAVYSRYRGALPIRVAVAAVGDLGVWWAVAAFITWLVRPSRRRAAALGAAVLLTAIVLAGYMLLQYVTGEYLGYVQPPTGEGPFVTVIPVTATPLPTQIPVPSPTPSPKPHRPLGALPAITPESVESLVQQLDRQRATPEAQLGVMGQLQERLWLLGLMDRCVYWAHAGEHVGEWTCVCGTVHHIQNKDNTGYIHFDDDNEAFYGFIYGSWWKDEVLGHRCILICGEVEANYGRPRIEIVDPEKQLLWCQ